MDLDINGKIKKFFGDYSLRHYARGQVLILGEQDTKHVYYIVKGKVKQYSISHKGDEVIVNTFKPPAFFPMSLAINRGSNKFVYEAETDIEVRQAPATEAVSFIKDNPDVMFDLLSRLYIGVDGLLERMVQLMSGNAQTRLIYEIVLEGARFGNSDDRKSCTILITEKDLGTRAGLARETVNREISKLKKEGLIEVKNQSVVIKNISALNKKLHAPI